MKKLFTILFLFIACISNAQNNLDKITGLSSTTASVAYSLRQLSNGYIGPLVRIKVGASFYDVYPDATSNKFSLSSKISAAIGTYNAAVAAASANALSTIISGSIDATVAIWYDQSGNGVHVLSSSPNAKIIASGSINTMNGQPTINFTGTNSFLASSTTVNYTTQTHASVNAVAQDVASTNYISGILSTGDNGGWGLCYDPTNTIKGYWVDASGGNGALSNEHSSDAKIITGLIGITSNSFIYVNGMQKGSKVAQSIAHGSTDKIYVGSRGNFTGRQFIGKISETMMFPKTLSAAEQAALESSQSIFLAPSVTITSSASGAVCAGTNITFTATVTGLPSPTYQWTRNGATIPGATSSTYATSTLSNNDQIQVYVNGGITNANIVSNGLKLNLDASNPGSYAGAGTTWYDLSGNNNHATLNNSPTYDATSGSIVTNGTNQYLSIPLFNNSITNVTMQAWVYINTNSKGVFIANGYGNGYNIGIGNSGGFDVNGSSASMLFSGARWMFNTSTYTAGWHLVSMVLNGSSTPFMYIDNALKGSSTGYPGTAPNIPTDYLTLGAIPGDQGRYYAGKFAAAYFYDRALSLAEITQNYNAFSTKTTAYNSNTITVTVSGTLPTVSVIGDGCINKTTLSTTSGQTAYAWYKDDVAINGATSNSYTPTASGSFKVQVTSGSCSSFSSATNITNCSVASDGSMKTISNANSIISPEGGANFGTGRDYSGKLYNTIGLTTTSGTIGSSTAVLGGIISPTNSVTTSIGVIYSTDINFGTYSSTTIQSNVAAGTYTSTITGLAATTNYFAKSFIVNKAGTSYGSVLNFTTTSPPIVVGSLYQGGVIAYVLQPGDPGHSATTPHGLIAAVSDQSSGIRWYNGTWSTTNANGTAIGTGLANTNTIIASQGAVTTSYAAGLARAYNGGGYTDWYLPSKNELNTLYLNKTSIGGFSSGYYISSSEETNQWTDYDVWRQSFSNGSQESGNYGKSQTLYVRAIRSF